MNSKTMKNHEFFVAIDGDDVGLKLRELIIKNDITCVSEYSSRLLSYFTEIKNLLIQMDGKIIFCGGDSILAIMNNSAIENLKNNLPTGPCTISIGVADSAEKAYLALQLAKARGKDRLIHLHNTEVTSTKL